MDERSVHLLRSFGFRISSFGRILVVLGFALVILAVQPQGARAAISFVQETTARGGGTNPTTTPNFGSAVTVGNLIVVGIGWTDAGITVNSVTDTVGNVYVSALAQQTNVVGAATIHHQIWYAKNVKAGTDAVTVTLSSVAGVIDFVSVEYSGSDTSNPLDQISSATGTSAVMDSGSKTTTVPNELIFGGGYSGSIPGPGGMFTQRGVGTEAEGVIEEDRIVSSVGTFSATSSAGTIIAWVMQMATFKPAAAASPGVNVSSRSDTLSDSRPSATSNHTVSFKTNTAIYGSSVSGSSTVTLTFPSSFTFPATFDCGDVDAATSSQFNFNYPACAATATAWGFSATGSVITLVPPSDTATHVATGTQITIKIGSNATVGQTGIHWITNPSTGGTYTVSVGGSFGGLGNMLVSIQAGFTVQAQVAESLSVSVAGASALQVVQAVQNVKDGTSVSAPAMVNTSGDSLKVACREGNDETSITGVTDTVGNTYTLVNKTSGTVGGNRELAFYEALNIKSSGNNVVSCNFASGLTLTETIVVMEVAGLNTSNDQDGSVTSALAVLGTTVTSGLLTTANANDILIYTVTISNDNTISCGAGYTIPTNGSNLRSAMCYQIVASTGTYSATSTWGTSSGANGIFAAFTGGSNIQVVQAAQNLIIGSSVKAPAMVNTAGNSLKVACREGVDTTSISGVTDTAGNSYALVNNSFSGTTHESALYEALNIQSSSNNVVSCNFASNLNTVEDIVVMEVSGLLTSNDIGTSVTSALASVGLSVTSGPITTTSAKSILIYEVGFDGDQTASCGVGYTIPANGTNRRAIMCYQIVYATGTYSATSTWSNSHTANGVFAAFTATSSICTADDGATINTVSTTANTVPFGTISSNTFYQGCQDISVSTNAGGGYSVTVQESRQMQTSGGATIPDTTCDAGNCTTGVATAWTNPAKNGFGHTCRNQTGNDCSGAYGNGVNFRPFASMGGGGNGISFVQSASSSCNVASSCASGFNSNNTAGNTIVVGFDWSDNVNFSSISDTQGNTYTQAGVESHLTSGNEPEKLRIYYAKNIKAGANTVTTTLSGAATTSSNVYIHEYSGLDTVAPFDVTASSAGTSTTLDSGSVTTNFANELIFGYGIQDVVQTPLAGSSFTARSTAQSNITEDKTVSVAGSYTATASVPSSANWLMRVATFKSNNQSPWEVLMASSTPAIATSRVKYRLSASPAQGAGTYTTVITYTVIGTF